MSFSKKRKKITFLFFSHNIEDYFSKMAAKSAPQDLELRTVNPEVNLYYNITQTSPSNAKCVMNIYPTQSSAQQCPYSRKTKTTNDYELFYAPGITTPAGVIYYFQSGYTRVVLNQEIGLDSLNVVPNRIDADCANFFGPPIATADNAEIYNNLGQILFSITNQNANSVDVSMNLNQDGTNRVQTKVCLNSKTDFGKNFNKIYESAYDATGETIGYSPIQCIISNIQNQAANCGINYTLKNNGTSVIVNDLMNSDPTEKYVIPSDALPQPVDKAASCTLS